MPSSIPVPMAAELPNPVEAPPHVLALLDRLHRESEHQESRFDFSKYTPDTLHAAVKDKFIALDQDKCHMVYQLCRAINAKNIVEAGTSFGVSTMYLGLAVTRNVQATGRKVWSSAQNTSPRRPKRLVHTGPKQETRSLAILISGSATCGKPFGRTSPRSISSCSTVSV